MVMKEIEDKVINELKKYEKSESNRDGMIKALQRCPNYIDALTKLYIYLTDITKSKTRDSIFRYIYRLRGIEIEES